MRRCLEKSVTIYPRLLDRIKWLLSFRIVSNNYFYKKYILRKVAEHTKNFDNSGLLVGIENTIECNSRCIMCLHNKKDMNGLMSMQLYNKIIKECAENRIQRVSFGVYGEPLSDPYFLERVEGLVKYNLDYMLITNGSLMNSDLANKMLEYDGFREIRFSVNGLSKETYEKVMPGLDRGETYDTILNFLDLKNRLKKDVTVNISCVKTRYAEGELDEFVRFWKSQKGINRVYLLDIIDRSGDLTGPDGIGTRDVLDRDGIWFQPCNQLWLYLSVYYDGRVAPCCVDHNDRRFIVGDISKNTLKEILSAGSYEELRNYHKENRRHEHPVCGKCHYPTFWY